MKAHIKKLNKALMPGEIKPYIQVFEVAMSIISSYLGKVMPWISDVIRRPTTIPKLTAVP